MTDTVPKVGILGVGHLISYLVPGMLRGSEKPDFLLSPRNHQIAQTLAQNHELKIAASNAELVEACDVVIVAVRPMQVKEALDVLAWRPDQTILSLCAGVSIAEMSAHTHGATIIRALPVTAARFGESPTALYPDCNIARSLLAPCGPIVVLENEDQFDAASMFGAYYGWIQHLIGEMTEWATASGLHPGAARLLASQMTRAAATMVRDTPEKQIDALVEELCLPGSITGLGLDCLHRAEAFKFWHQAGNSVLQQLKSSNI